VSSLLSEDDEDRAERSLRQLGWTPQVADCRQPGYRESGGNSQLRIRTESARQDFVRARERRSLILPNILPSFLPSITAVCMPSSLHRFFSRERRRPVRFFHAALLGVWDLSCSVSSLPAPILVLSQSRMCCRGSVVCVVELATRAGLCRRCRQQAKRCIGLN
jgi:hypothetical protein